MKKNKGKLPKEFVCVKCDYKCGYPSEYIRHLGTVKHNKTEKPRKKLRETYANTNIYLCPCGKECEGQSVLREHVDTCKNNGQYIEYMKSCDSVVPEKTYERIKPILEEFRNLRNLAISVNAMNGYLYPPIVFPILLGDEYINVRSLRWL